ncbi:MAG: YeeE/YedE family protein [Proteobacteria bacterium]|nr:YeeE/YedE family protein [Pseudomonadota bacterium]
MPGAALLGVSNAILFYFFGNWFFTSAFLRTARSLTGAEDSSVPILWAFFTAVLVGMVASSRQRRAFRPVRPSADQLARHFLGGGLMGFGAALVPGGNDSLVLGGIPGLSPHAIPAYAAIIGGIFLALAVMRSIGGRIPPIDCSGDICASD